MAHTKNPRRLPLLRGLALAVAGLFVAGCTTAAEAGPAGDGRIDTIRIGVASLPATMDPTINPGNASVAIHWNIFDTLIWADQQNGYALEPLIAAEWERVDDRTLDVTIDTSVLFHTGEPVDAHDVKFTFDRMHDDIAGMELSRSLMSTIESVEVVADDLVRVRTSQPDPILEQRLSSIWGAWVISKDYYEEVGPEEFGRAPVGTGPFQVEEVTPERVVLTRFEDYAGEPPAVDRIEYVKLPETAPRITALLSGEMDIIAQIPPDQVATVAGRDGFETVSVTIENMHLLTLNTKAPGLQDERLRQALSLGIDRQLLIDTLWHGDTTIPNGHQFPQYGDMVVADYPAYEYDPERARALVEESTYAGEEIVYALNPNYYTNSAQAAEAIVSMWKEIGVNASVVFAETPTMHEGAGVVPWSNSLRFPDPLGGLWLLWGSRAADPSDTAFWNDPEFVRIGTELETAMDDVERKQIAQELMARWDQQVPAFPLYYPYETWGIRDGLNWEPYASYTMDFRAGNFSVGQ